MARKWKTNRDFRHSLIGRERLLGAFVKTPHPIIVEVMASSGYDFLVLDAEHAPFDRGTIDACILAGQAAGCPIIVRVPIGSSEWLSFVLDCGAAGVMVPHVSSLRSAQELARLTRYGPNGRGFAGTTRAAAYAERSMTEHLRETAREIVVIAQIEDPEAVTDYEEISNVDGIDALFVGRADLAVGYEINDFFDQQIARVTHEILGAKNAATGLYCSPDEDLSPFMDSGANLFVVGSEHSSIRTVGKSMRTAFEFQTTNMNEKSANSSALNGARPDAKQRTPSV